MGCREFFEAQDGTKSLEKCKVLQQQDEQTNVAWEKEGAASHSPHPVADEEQLVRYWLNPIHYDAATGALKPTAFDDASDKGLSVNRRAHIELHAIERMAADRATAWNALFPAKPQRSVFGYSDFEAREVRAIVASGPPPQRALAVYDTAKADDISHADVCQIASSAKGGRSARYQLRDLANGRLKVF